MKHTKFLAALLAALLMLGALYGCASSPATEPPAEATAAPADESVSITDMSGREITLSEPATRIVALAAADCEILYAIGAGDTIVGRTIECDYPDEANLLPYVTVDGKTDSDLVLLRQPQLVVMGADAAADADLISALRSAGVLYIVTNSTDVNNMYGAISLLGTVTNHAAEASALVSSLITSIAQLQTKISQHSETVYLELTPLSEGLTTVGGGTIFSSLVSLLGYHNEFEDQLGALSITQDQVIGRSPGIIITAAKSADDAVTSPDSNATADPNAATDPDTEAAPTGPAEILAREEWETIAAVKNGRVYYIDAALLTRAGPRITEGLAALYTVLYENTQP